MKLCRVEQENFRLYWHHVSELVLENKVCESIPFCQAGYLKMSSVLLICFAYGHKMIMTVFMPHIA
jgi:hypothetical protein